MSIYRCNSCFYLGECSLGSEITEISCPRCGNPTKIYDTIIFTQKIIDGYLALKRDIQIMKQESLEKPVEYENAAQINEQNILSDIDFHSTDILANEEQHEPLRKWFVQRNINPGFNYSAVDMSGYFDEAAQEIGKHYDVLRDTLGKIGWAYRKNHTGINLDLTSMPQKNGQIINGICRQLYTHTLFSKYFYQKHEKNVHLGLQSATATKQFFNGGWLEWYALGVILKEISQQGREYIFSCARNVDIQFDDGDRHELDIVLYPKRQIPIIIECKSGEFRHEIEKYVRLQKRLKLPAGHFLILVTEVNSDQADALSSMYGLHFVSLNDLKKSLQKII